MTDRNSRDNQGPIHKDRSNGSPIEKEVDEILKKGELTVADIIALNNKYADNQMMVDAIIRMANKGFKKIDHKAYKAAQQVYAKYHRGDRPLHEIFDLMMKYKSKHHWSDYQYDLFRKYLSQMLTGKRATEIDKNPFMHNNSKINLLFGEAQPVKQIVHRMNVKSSDKPILEEIVRMYNENIALYQSVFMNTIMYEDCSILAMSGTYKREENRIASNFIHAVLACLFLPKFAYLESLMLYSNFGSLIKSSHEGTEVKDSFDALLLESIRYDPNDVVCSMNSPMEDIRDRYRVQINLWHLVLKLRNGLYYDTTHMNQFLALLNGCRANLYDNADLTLVQNEISIMRQLFSVFSARPIIISTRSLNFNPQMGQNFNFPGQNYSYQNQFNTTIQETVTKIPMLQMWIPPINMQQNQQSVNINDIVSQTVWIYENGTQVPKEQTIIGSNELLIFFVNRRNTMAVTRTFTSNISFSQLPIAMGNFEQLNKSPVNVQSFIKLNNSQEVFNLRSVVLANDTNFGGENGSPVNIITGSSGLIVSNRNSENFETTHYLYDPFAASIPVKRQDNTYTLNKPVSIIDGYYTTPLSNESDNSGSFYDRASTNGVIYIYAKSSGYDPRDMINTI